MHLFRVRLILALIVAVTLVSVASTYFDVLAHKHTLRVELERRVKWMGLSMQPDVIEALETGDPSVLPGVFSHLKSGTGTLGLAIYDGQGKLLACAGPQEVLQALPYGVIQKSIQKGDQVNAFGHAGNWQWLEEAQPLHNGNALIGTLAIVADAGYIRTEGIAVWQRSFLRVAALVFFIVVVTLAMVSWFLLRPMMQVAERLRLLRLRANDT
jgi:sensor histidine kinase regulating citrate/malate metabolism